MSAIDRLAPLPLQFPRLQGSSVLRSVWQNDAIKIVKPTVLAFTSWLKINKGNYRRSLTNKLIYLLLWLCLAFGPLRLQNAPGLPREVFTLNKVLTNTILWLHGHHLYVKYIDIRNVHLIYGICAPPFTSFLFRYLFFRSDLMSYFETMLFLQSRI